MCGICGFISKREISVEKLVEMNNTMYHRGPNDSGEIIMQREGYSVGLAHRRLSILDLSVAGHQPMNSKDDMVTIVFNGEIYNFNELKKEITDYHFVSTCDTEVIIAAYLKWGIKAIEKFNGMFAIGIYDKRVDKLFLCRDRIGKKPLYYWCDGDNIVFASELKPIMKSPGFIPVLNKKVIGKFIFHQYILAPQTIFENVYKVCPGEIVSFSKGSIEKTKYWGVKGTTCSISYPDAKLELKEMLVESCRKRMISDVPIGVFLSGGIDSSLIAAIARSLDGNIKTFSIGFNDEKYNEAQYAKEISKHLGTVHKELYLDESSLFDFLKDLSYYYDEPLADNSQISTMAVSKLAKEDVTVVLSGDGGDELFCGYDSYVDIINNKKNIKLATAMKIFLDFTGIKNNKLIRSMLPNNLNGFVDTYRKELGNQFWLGYYESLLRDLLIEETYSDLNFNEISFTKNDVFNKMLNDQLTYIPDDILCKVDRASMKYSQEVRCPLLDYKIVEFANSLPFEYKYNGTKKRILKDIVYEYIPNELLDRPKMGFAIPTEKWLKSKLKDRVRGFADINRLKNQGIFNPVNMNKFIEDYFNGTMAPQLVNLDNTRIVWSFYVLQDWLEYYGIS